MYGIKHTEPEELKESCKQQRINAVACNLHQFQDLVYSEDMDVVCVNETWLKESIDTIVPVVCLSQARTLRSRL